jgi:hypothetical protein
MSAAFLPFRRFSRPLSFLLLLVALAACAGGTNDDRGAAPNLVILGEDLSQTITGFTPTTEQDLRDVCEAVARTRAGGKVYFIGIGNATPKGFAECEIRALPVVDRRDAVGVQQKQLKKRQQLQARNTAEIDRFIAAAQAMLSAPRQRNTDINGFFDKASALANAAGTDGYDKWLFVNSDGRQDTKQSKTVDCDLKIGFDHYYVSHGWKKQPDCAPDGRFLTPRQFIQFFQSETQPVAAAARD